MESFLFFYVELYFESSDHQWKWLCVRAHLFVFVLFDRIWIWLREKSMQYEFNEFKDKFKAHCSE